MHVVGVEVLGRLAPPRAAGRHAVLEHADNFVKVLPEAHRFADRVAEGEELLGYLGAEDGHVDRPGGPAVPEATELRIGSPEIIAPVLSRALTALAARHEITVDRISDAMLLADAISAAAPRGFDDGHVQLSIADRPEGVELKVGPMRSGAAESLRESLSLPDVGGSLETLADEVRTESDGDGDYLVVGIAAAAS